MNKLHIRFTKTLTAVAGADGVSMTANPSGFTPLASVAGVYRYDGRVLTRASKACNDRGEVAVLKELRPTAFLVPLTHGTNNSAFLIKDLLDAVDSEQIQILHFTHFHHLLSFPENELRLILQSLQARESASLPTILFDMSQRFAGQFKRLFEDLFPGHHAPCPGEPQNPEC